MFSGEWQETQQACVVCVRERPFLQQARLHTICVVAPFSPPSLTIRHHLLKSHSSFSQEFFVKQPAEKYIQTRKRDIENKECSIITKMHLGCISFIIMHLLLAMSGQGQLSGSDKGQQNIPGCVPTAQILLLFLFSERSP